MLKRYWWLLLCFLLPFLVGFSAAWIWVQYTEDRVRGALSTDQEIQEKDLEIDQKALREGVFMGTVSAVAGISIGLLISSLRSRKKDT